MFPNDLFNLLFYSKDGACLDQSAVDLLVKCGEDIQKLGINVEDPTPLYIKVLKEIISKLHQPSLLDPSEEAYFNCLKNNIELMEKRLIEKVKATTMQLNSTEVMQAEILPNPSIPSSSDDVTSIQDIELILEEYKLKMTELNNLNKELAKCVLPLDESERLALIQAKSDELVELKKKYLNLYSNEGNENNA